MKRKQQFQWCLSGFEASFEKLFGEYHWAGHCQNYSLLRVWLEEFRRKTLWSWTVPAVSPQPFAHHKQQQHLHKLTKTGAFSNEFTSSELCEFFYFLRSKPVFYLGIWWGLSIEIWGQTQGDVNLSSPSMGMLHIQSSSIHVLTHCHWELNGLKWSGDVWKEILNYCTLCSFTCM